MNDYQPLTDFQKWPYVMKGKKKLEVDLEKAGMYVDYIPADATKAARKHEKESKMIKYRVKS